MIKLTVLYGHPANSEDFESYYSKKHLPLASTMSGFEKVEFTRFLDSPDGLKPDYYRMAEFWFESPEALKATMSSPQGQATAADLTNFATGGVKLLVGTTANQTS